MNRPESSLPPDPLGLKHLPSRQAPESLWPSIEARLNTPTRRHARVGWLGLAAAAGLTALLALPLREPPSSTDPLDQINASEATLASAPNAAGQVDMRLTLATARQLSAALEAELDRSRRNPLPAAALAGLVWTETELRLTDELLLNNPPSLELWQQRIALLDELNRRYQQNHWQQDLLLTSL